MLAVLTATAFLCLSLNFYFLALILTYQDFNIYQVAFSTKLMSECNY